MSANRVGRVRSIEVQEARRGRTHTKHLTYHTKGLHGHSHIRVQLTWRHVDRLKDAHHECVKRKRHMQVRKKTIKHEEEREFGG